MPRRGWLGLVVAAVTLTVVHALVGDGWRTAVYAVTAGGALVALLRGLWRRPLVARPAWMLLTVGATVAMAGDLVWSLYIGTSGNAFGTWTDLFYLVSYPLFAAGLWQLTRRRRRADRAVLVDAAILGIAGLVIAWTYLLEPQLADSSLTTLERAVAVSYPIGDLLVLPLIVRLVFVHGGRIRSHVLLLASMLAMLLLDSAHTAGALNHWNTHDAWDSLWLLHYGLLAAAMWHPSACKEPPAPAPISRPSQRRLLALALTSLMAPVILLVHEPPETSVGWVAGIASILLFLLVVRRMALLMEQVDQQARALAVLSHTDPLTGAGNRRALDEALRRELHRVEREGRPLAFALFDFDRFKQFNDLHGHLAGDDLLRDTVAAWQQQLRTGDLLARYGGEEFAVLLPGADVAAASAIVERLRAAVPGGQTCSAGIAVARPGDDRDRLMRAADDALYAAKAGGRDRTEVAATQR